LPKNLPKYVQPACLSTCLNVDGVHVTSVRFRPSWRLSCLQHACLPLELPECTQPASPNLQLWICLLAAASAWMLNCLQPDYLTCLMLSFVQSAFSPHENLPVYLFAWQLLIFVMNLPEFWTACTLATALIWC
jgi:hypothetical protein